MSFGRAGLGALQLAEHHPGYARMLDDEFHMAHEHGPQRGHGRVDALGGAVDPAQQALRHPFHHRPPDRVLGREVAKQGALGDAHVFGDGRGGDLAGVDRPGQFDHGLDGHGAALVGGKVFGMGVHEYGER
jgi:hypothetical protein